jgi:hypothetical protein
MSCSSLPYDMRGCASCVVIGGVEDPDKVVGFGIAADSAPVELVVDDGSVVGHHGGGQGHSGFGVDDTGLSDRDLAGESSHVVDALGECHFRALVRFPHVLRSAHPYRQARVGVDLGVVAIEKHALLGQRYDEGVRCADVEWDDLLTNECGPDEFIFHGSGQGVKVFPWLLPCRGPL